MRNNKGQFSRVSWYYRDSYWGKSPAEIVGTITPLMVAGGIALWFILNSN